LYRQKKQKLPAEFSFRARHQRSEEHNQMLRALAGFVLLTSTIDARLLLHELHAEDLFIDRDKYHLQTETM
tara:strand:- start:336 stop:548 length:213 start_codon:yes stop_codon:yes gene_type:complete